MPAGQSKQRPPPHIKGPPFMGPLPPPPPPHMIPPHAVPMPMGPPHGMPITGPGGPPPPRIPIHNGHMSVPPGAPIPYGPGVNGTMPHDGPPMESPYPDHGYGHGPKPKHIPLAKCRVLYLGSAVPTETAVGLEAVQHPLRERYPFEKDGDVPGIDAWLIIYSSGMLMQYVGDVKNVTWFPIQTLHVCAAVKCNVVINGATGERAPKFVPLDSPEADDSDHPPIFSTIMRRTKGVKVLECHVFLCKSNQAAMALVQSCTHAYEHKEGWTDEAPPINESNSMRLFPASPQKEKPVAPEFYDKPPPQGYFYSTRKDLVKNYNIFGGNNKPTNTMTSGGPPMAPQPPPPPPGTMGPPPHGTMGPPPPHMMQPMLVPGPPGPYGTYLPPPPPGYFADWEMMGGQPIMIFPPMPDDVRAFENQRGGSGRNKSRQRSPSPRKNSKKEHRSRKSKSRHQNRAKSPKPTRPLSPGRTRPRSPSPRQYSDYEYTSSSSYSEYSDRRARSPPADYHHSRNRRGPAQQEQYGSRDRDRSRAPSDFVLYAPQYNNHGDEFFYDGRPKQQPTGGRAGDMYNEYHSSYNPEIFLRDNEDGRRRHDPSSDESRRRESPRPKPRDYDNRRYPRQEREFGNSIMEERKAVGDLTRDLDAYRINDEPHLDMDMFHRKDDLYSRGLPRADRPTVDMERTLGYYP